MTVKIRLRAPQGVSTLDLDPETTTIDDLKVLIFSNTEIPPDEQDIKYGYPPKPLPSAAGPLSSIPIGRGEQLIVSSVPSSGSSKKAPVTAQPPATTNSALAASRPISASPILAAPLVSNASQDQGAESGESVALPGRDAGYLQLRVVPDDNSCLFSAIGVVFEGGIEAAQRLRTVVANAIKDDPFTYSEVMLGQPIDQYVKRIQKPQTWGGAIELSIFAKHYKTEIASFDVATGRCDRFGQDEYDSRCLLVYSGIHYDAISLSPLPVSPASFHTTVFPVTDQTILTTADKLVSQLRARHYYTDTANFDLRCAICKTGLRGEKGAREHAMQTGHVEFGEY
ncbi:ubiquitin thioesterase OTU1 [Cryptococcus neoformans C23]|uniref:Ubiquitin thioesterase OTU n=2 Tax=Cryptococcus neoformans TaxID=5207 RepID=A0A854QAE9_CRYNE|nr:ubiquitin thioesterase OTU1 [Cryptococcus neoformans var. grubii H99]AUB28842.1 ubiquitin thioesterase OTU1 [Cryptococcus neoformans var. grubii]OWZ26992.1 ubiquitin thioesterase OTU1 [Cryptococcus neoformans var. grubii AD2-60a]OWZ27823.1 ubiquitin thioesterase OTU1 [Cryptococcus neoformans var. grubii AD1-83a]OWZ38853.1 ubiquitin thioesterase OTU1 [Cryptococcus neoformans var. grubii C23]OXC81250.1 ubiquitin thioesterase OTU1 [Cryptococcus neoformans var. grubii AD1-7a]OXG10808.1 ubiquit|eukprot:XP_012053328.1 ubiquitin thioesterase OTU1 [Cryptococcus neoformans var. grubii H99]